MVVKSINIVWPVVISVLLGNRYYNDDGYKFNTNKLNDDVVWCWNRVPNFDEIFTMSWPLAVFNMGAESLVNRLYDANPIAKAVIRDWTKIPSTIASWWSGNEIGGTHIKYDEGSLYGSVSKVICKSVLIAGYANFHPGLESGGLEGISRASNYLCEPTTRVFGLISKEKQLHNATNIPYLEFAQNTITTELLIQSTAEGIIKTSVADQVGGYLGELGIFSFLKQLYISTENKYFYSITGIKTGSPFFYQRMQSIPNAQIHIPKKIFILITLPVLDFTLKTSSEMVTTMLLAPASRIAQDIIGSLTNQGYKYFSKVANSEGDLIDQGYDFFNQIYDYLVNWRDVDEV